MPNKGRTKLKRERSGAAYLIDRHKLDIVGIIATHIGVHDEPLEAVHGIGRARAGAPVECVVEHCVRRIAAGILVVRGCRSARVNTFIIVDFAANLQMELRFSCREIQDRAELPLYAPAY